MADIQKDNMKEQGLSQTPIDAVLDFLKRPFVRKVAAGGSAVATGLLAANIKAADANGPKLPPMGGQPSYDGTPVPNTSGITTENNRNGGVTLKITPTAQPSFVPPTETPVSTEVTNNSYLKVGFTDLGNPGFDVLSATQSQIDQIKTSSGYVDVTTKAVKFINSYAAAKQLDSAGFAIDQPIFGTGDAVTSFVIRRQDKSGTYSYLPLSDGSFVEIFTPATKLEEQRIVIAPNNNGELIAEKEVDKPPKFDKDGNIIDPATSVITPLTISVGVPVVLPTGTDTPAPTDTPTKQPDGQSDNSIKLAKYQGTPDANEIRLVGYDSVGSAPDKPLGKPVDVVTKDTKVTLDVNKIPEDEKFKGESLRDIVNKYNIKVTLGSYPGSNQYAIRNGVSDGHDPYAFGKYDYFVDYSTDKSGKTTIDITFDFDQKLAKYPKYFGPTLSWVAMSAAMQADDQDIKSGSYETKKIREDNGIIYFNDVILDSSINTISIFSLTSK